MHTVSVFAGLAAAVLFAAAAGPAGAAPQILALLATEGAVPLACRDGACTAEFSGLCLQRKRPDPAPQTRYHAIGGEVTLVITGADGTVRRLPAAAYLSIETRRSYTAVEIGVSEALMTAWNAVSLAVEVGEHVALVPVPEAADPDPQTAADIALALGPQRALGDRVLEASPVETGAARLTSRLIGALPPGRVDGATRATLWDRVATPSAAAFPPTSVARAGSVYRRCLEKVEAGRYYSLRRCLEIGHDALMIELNLKYWQAGPES